MKTVNFTHLHIENFGKHITPIDSKLGQRVLISGANATGKSTVKRAIQYILGTKDENGKEISGIRPHDSEGNDIDGLTTVAALVVSVDGAENTLKRTCFQEKNRQGEYTGKDNLQYFVDDVKKGTKKAYEEFVGSFLPSMVCISAQEFISKDTAGRRAMLEVFSEHDTDSIIDENPDFEPLRAKLKANTVADLKKACRDKIKTQTKERDAYPARIDELEKQKVDIDVAELELLKNSLNEQIAENKTKQADVSKQFEEYDKQSKDILDLQFELNDLERKANEELHKNALRLTEQQLKKEEEIKTLQMQKDSLLYKNKELERNIGFYVSKTNSLRDKWNFANQRVFDENSLICSMCGQEYPEEEKERLRVNFVNDKAEELERLTISGKEFAQMAEESGKALKENKGQIKSIDERLEKLKEELRDIEEEQDKLPQSIDISDREDVKTIKQQIVEKEQAMNKANSGAEIKQQLQSECEDLQSQLNEVNSKLSLAQRNIEIDKRVAELQKEQRELSQKIADVERELDLLKSFERKKAELLESDVNKNFEFVQFRMFEQQQNGDLKDVCLITVGGESYDRNLNFSNRLLAEVDICRGFQKKFDVQLPVILDNSESVNDFRLPDVENQLILLKCTDEPQLTIKNLE